MAAVYQDEKRRSTRISREYVIEFRELTASEYPQKTLISRAVNISIGGVSFMSESSFDVGTILELKIHIQRWERFSKDFMKFDQTSISKPLMIIGKVIHVKKSSDGDLYLIGAAFENIFEAHRDALGQYLEHISS